MSEPMRNWMRYGLSLVLGACGWAAFADETRV